MERSRKIRETEATGRKEEYFGLSFAQSCGRMTGIYWSEDNGTFTISAAAGMIAR